MTTDHDTNLREVELVLKVWVDRRIPLDSRLTDRVRASIQSIRSDHAVHYASAEVRLRSLSDARRARAPTSAADPIKG